MQSIFRATGCAVLVLWICAVHGVTEEMAGRALSALTKLVLETLSVCLHACSLLLGAVWYIQHMLLALSSNARAPGLLIGQPHCSDFCSVTFCEPSLLHPSFVICSCFLNEILNKPC